HDAHVNDDDEDRDPQGDCPVGDTPRHGILSFDIRHAVLRRSIDPEGIYTAWMRVVARQKARTNGRDCCRTGGTGEGLCGAGSTGGSGSGGA
ncbi:MAG: hypothetical protein WC406_09630, partial [Methanoregula sp.]